MAKASFAGGLVRECRNWPMVATRLALSYAGRPGRELRVVTSKGVTLVSPNTPTARWPMFEILLQDAYHMGRVGLDRSAAVSVLDIGAQVGSFTCFFAARFPNATFTCCEPSSSARWLRRNLATNGLNDRAQVIEAGVGAADGSATLWVTGEASAQASRFVQKGEPMDIPMRSLASVVAGMAAPPDLVKLDCEGSEHEILDCDDGLWASVRHVLIEYQPVGDRGYESVRGRLETLGFAQNWNEWDAVNPGTGTAYFCR